MGTFLLIVAALVIVIGVAAAIGAEKTKKQVHQAYLDSLEALKENPANSDLRQKTLALGRIYSNLMRDQKGNTLFDEVALMNDINAACAATHQVIASQPKVIADRIEPIEERLLKLQSLRDKGLIDEEDFSRRKREIMDLI